MLRYLPEYSEAPDRQRRILGLSYLTSVVGGVGLAVVLLVSAPSINDLTLSDPRFVVVLRAFAVLLLLRTLLKLTSSAFRATESIQYEVAVNNIIDPTIRIVAVGAVLFAGYSLIGVIGAVVAAGVVVLAVAFVFLFSGVGVRPSLPRNLDEITEYYSYTLPLSFQGIGALLYQRVDVLMVGYFLTSESVGVYNIAMLLAAFLTFPLGAFNQLAPSVISKLYHDGDINELRSVYETITRWIVTVSLPLAAGLVVYRRELLSIFGSEYLLGGTVLVVLAIGQLLNVAVGSTGYVLMMTGHQYISSGSVVASGILNLVLNYLFIQWFGLIGAAVATAAVIGAQNLSQLIAVWYFEGLLPYSIAFVKPLAAAVGAAVVMFVLSAFLSGFALLIVGGGIGSVAFAALLIVMGVEDEDMEYFDAYVRPLLGIADR
jgi:O-antigen/teichoic acid export membrane protein